MMKNILSYSKDSEDYIHSPLKLLSSREGMYGSIMKNLSSYIEGVASYHLLYKQDLFGFKRFIHTSSKIKILAGSNNYMYEEPKLYDLNLRGFNVGKPLFGMILSDSPKLKRYLILNIEKFLASENTIRSLDLMTAHMRYNTLLMLEGSRLNELKVRSELFLSDVPKFGKKRIPDYEFFLAFSNQDPAAMRKALEPLFKPGQARIAAREVATLFDFYLQPQLVMYTKLASMHGYDLQIDLEIAPKALTDYDPLPEEEYLDGEFEFMKRYDLDFPYEYQQIWLDYYLKKRDIMIFPTLE